MEKYSKDKMFEKLAQADYSIFLPDGFMRPMIFPGYSTWLAHTSQEGIIVITEVYKKGMNIQMTRREQVNVLPYSSFNHNVTRTNSEFPNERGFGYLIMDVDEKQGLKISKQMCLNHFVYYRHEPEFQTFLIGTGRFSGKRLLIFEFPE